METRLILCPLSMHNPLSYDHIWKTIVDKLNYLHDHDGLTWEKIGEIVGVNRSTAHRWAKGERGGEGTAAPDLFRYIDALGLSIFNFADRVDDEFGFVRKVRAKLGAGSSLLVDDSTESYYAFRKDFLRSFGCNARLSLFTVLGDSMAPKIEHNDMVMINEAEKDLQNAMIYGVGVGDELLIKRVIKTGPQIILRSDNTDKNLYPDIILEENIHTKIIGKVRWISRTVG